MPAGTAADSPERAVEAVQAAGDGHPTTAWKKVRTVAARERLVYWSRASLPKNYSCLALSPKRENLGGYEVSHHDP